jgi:general stress protein 26
MPRSKAAPRAAPLRLTPGYSSPGTKPKLLPWSFAEQRLRAARNYWICSTRPDRRPHAAPVWGLWLDSAFFFSTDPSSRKGKNLKARADVVVHLENGDEVVIVEGLAAAVEVTKDVDRAYAKKYGMHLIGFPAPMVLFRVQPRAIQAWREKAFPASATRFTFSGTGARARGAGSGKA